MKVALDPLGQTALLTLHLRALDSRGPRPILADTRSAEIADQLDYDFAKLKAKPSLVCATALRAKKLDDAVRAFVSAHPDAVVLDLGCGLDPRQVRCGVSVDWYDVDVPEIIDLRRRFLPSAHLVAADLNDEGWIDDLPRDRPTMIVAEGVLPFMPGDSFQRMAVRLTDRLASGELALNGYTRFAAWAMKYHPTIKALGVAAAQGFDGPREPERWGAGLTLLEELFAVRAPEVAAFPQPLRALTRFMATSTSMSRQGTRILRYRF